jgi:hexosaminidase
MALCTDKIALSLEDDAPIAGDRAVFKVDIMEPCWLFKGADLSKANALVAAVGQVPFNFQIGDAVKEIPLHEPATVAGELEVRLDNCQGERIAVLPLAPAVENFAVTTLPAATIAPREGRHDLCLTFTRKSIDPIWTIDSIALQTDTVAGTE